MTGLRDMGALVMTVEEQEQGLAELETLLGQQARLLVEGGQSPLLDNLSFEEKILRKLAKLEEQRLRLLEELARAGRLTDPAAGLRALGAALPPPHGPRLIELAARIAERATAIRRLERRNRRLIESGLRCVDGFLRLIIAGEQCSPYGDAGRGHEPRIVSKEA